VGDERADDVIKAARDGVVVEERMVDSVPELSVMILEELSASVCLGASTGANGRSATDASA
jgi:hypothetical protein